MKGGPKLSRYEPRTCGQALGYLVEECGEVLAAAGKTLRWGPLSTNPTLPESEQETNRDWVLRELKDLEAAIKRARAALKQCEDLDDDFEFC